LSLRACFAGNAARLAKIADGSSGRSVAASERLGLRAFAVRACRAGRDYLRQPRDVRPARNAGVDSRISSIPVALRKSCDTLAVVAREDDHEAILNHALIESRRRYRA
jgi:hypothetical protein